LLSKLSDIKKECCEKKIVVEAETFEQAVKLCSAGADGIQFDKLTIEELKKTADYIKMNYPNVILLAAGGINEINMCEYAKTNIDGIVTSSLYNAKPIDIGVKIY